MSVAQAVEEQRARQAVLQAARGMGRLVLQIEVDALEAGQLDLDQVGIGGPVEVSVDPLDGLADPAPALRVGL